jgi:hypothetical protein
MLEAFVGVVHHAPDLAHLRLIVRTPADRQLTLFAALERAAIVGSPLVHPPRLDDYADSLLCDVLDALDRDRVTSSHGAFYGNDRRLVNLQALGAWRGNEPINRPTARELFTTRFAELSAEPAKDLRSPEAINSPLPQDSASGGELIVGQTAAAGAAASDRSSPESLDLMLVKTREQEASPAGEATALARLIHQNADQPGEERSPAAAGALSRAGADDGDPLDAEPLVPSRAVRRGRPPLLDERAKGRVLGLMAYGLSLRQAAAQLGIHHTTLLAAMKRDEEFAGQASEARLDAMAQPLITIVQASRRSWRAAAWLARFLEDRAARQAGASSAAGALTAAHEASSAAE